MADVTTVGFSPSQTLPANSLLRLTFGIRTDGARSSYDPFGQWPVHMSAVWAKLPIDRAHGGASLFTTTPANVTPQSSTATVDARIHAARTGVDVINSVAAIDDNFVALTRIELLTPAQVAVANTAVGALARDAATQTEAARAASDTWLSKITTAITLGSSTLKWVAAAVVLVLLVVAYRKVAR